MTLAKRALKRLGASIVVLWLVLTVAFLVHHKLPSDPARAIAGPQARPSEVSRIRNNLGLDRPILLQYSSFLKRLAHLGPSEVPPKDPEHGTCATFGPIHLDLGLSYQRRQPVTRIVGERIPRTVALASVALLVQLLLGIPLGILAALRRGTILDYGTITVALIGISSPSFVTGLILQYWLAYRLRWLPLDGYGATVSEQAISMVLPALTLGIFGAAIYARFVRDEMVTALDQDYVRTAIAKGLAPARVVGHALRNALLPVITLAGMDLGAFIGGTIVTEKLFRWPGLGSLMVDSVSSRDGPVVMGLVITGAVAVIVCNGLVDSVYALVDPRSRQQG